MKQPSARTVALTIAAAALCGWGLAARGDVVSETFGTASNKTAGHPGHLTIGGAGRRVVTVDLSAIPAGARVYRASLIARRREKGLEDRQDEWLLPALVYALPPGAGELPRDAQPLELEAPWYRSFDVTEDVRRAVAGGAGAVRFLVRQLYRWIPDATELRVTWEGKVDSVPPQATGVRAFHKGGNTFITWREIERLVDKDEITIGELASLREGLAQRDKTRRVRYEILRHTAPITAGNVAQARVLAQVGPLSCANRDGGLYHFNRKKDTQNRFVAEPTKGKLPWGTGLYVHTTTEKEGAFYYAVASVVNGRSNLKEISAANAPAEPVKEKASPYPIPVLQLDTAAKGNEFGGVRKGARVRLYAT